MARRGRVALRRVASRRLGGSLARIYSWKSRVRFVGEPRRFTLPHAPCRRVQSGRCNRSIIIMAGLDPESSDVMRSDLVLLLAVG